MATSGGLSPPSSPLAVVDVAPQPDAPLVRLTDAAAALLASQDAIQAHARTRASLSGLLALSTVCFGLSYVLFMKQEIRSI